MHPSPGTRSPSALWTTSRSVDVAGATSGQYERCVTCVAHVVRRVQRARVLLLRVWRTRLLARRRCNTHTRHIHTLPAATRAACSGRAAVLTRDDAAARLVPAAAAADERQQQRGQHAARQPPQQLHGRPVPRVSRLHTHTHTLSLRRNEWPPDNRQLCPGRLLTTCPCMRLLCGMNASCTSNYYILTRLLVTGFVCFQHFN